MESMSRAGLQLQKWYSSSEELRRLMNCKADDVNKMKKVLGDWWNQNDEFVFDFKVLVDEAMKLPWTKRNILCIGARFYDPVGLISPVVIIAKIYFQKTCLDELHWDDVLSDELAGGWRNYLQQLGEINSIIVDRYLFRKSDDVITGINLHGFCDSSNQAYCAVVYAQAESSGGIISRIITSKTKVAPIKKLSIPRLELLSCLLLSEVMANVQKLLRDVVTVKEVFYWSDSEVALAWIKGECKQWKPWVQSRTNKIKVMSDVKQWQYVNTKINPADIGTREGSIINFSRDDLWWFGPSFLRLKNVNSLDVVVEGQDVSDVNKAVKKDVLDEVNSALVLVVEV